MIRTDGHPTIAHYPASKVEAQEKTYDGVVTNHGSIYTIRSDNYDLTEWLEEHVYEPQCFGGAIVVEPRFLAPLLGAIEDAGFRLRFDR